MTEAKKNWSKRQLQKLRNWYDWMILLYFTRSCPPRYVECSACNGSGFRYDKNEHCRKCSGAGYYGGG